MIGELFNPALIVGAWRVQPSLVLITTTNSTLIVDYNPRRIYLMMSPQTTGVSMDFMPETTAIVNDGYRATQGTPLQFNYQQHGGLVHSRWNGIRGFAATNCRVIEVLYYPDQVGDYNVL